MSRRLRPRHRLAGQHGFTLIELLVVILVLGILAAIAIPALLGQRERAQDAAAKDNARTALTALLTYHVNTGGYDADVADLVEIEPSLGSAINLRVTGTDGANGSFTVSIDSKAGHTFGVEQADGGTQSRFCAPAGEGGCPISGSW